MQTNKAGARRRTAKDCPPDSKLGHYNVTLDDATVDVLKDIGGGNLSLGIRQAVRMLNLERSSIAPNEHHGEAQYPIS